MSGHRIRLTVNGRSQFASVEGRLTLSDFLRGDAGCTGVHVGCEHGVCGACTVLVDGAAVRSCLMLAVQADGSAITTVEGLAAADGTLHPVQQALRDEHGLQCGFCTPGILMTLAALTAGPDQADPGQVMNALSGHICRCTGYQGIRRAAQRLCAAAAPSAEHAHG
jgi:aerobic carbon-monoxide dehydrogenase small subunit